MPEAVWSDFPVLGLQGPLDIARLEYIDEILERVKGLPRVTLDLGDVDFVDAGAISRFVRLHNLIHPPRDIRGSTGFEPSIRLINVQPNVARLFELLQLEQLFEIHRIESGMPSDPDLRFLNRAFPVPPATANLQL